MSSHDDDNGGAIREGNTPDSNLRSLLSRSRAYNSSTPRLAMPSSSEDDPDMHFWEEQYRGELAEPFDWFFSFHDVPLPWWRDLLGGFETRVLVLGCGHSKLSEDLYAAGWKYVVSMDSSAAAIAMMQGRAPHLRWLVGDARDLAVCLAPLREVAPYGGPYGGEEPEFDCVLDKGLLDALLVPDRQGAGSGGAAARRHGSAGRRQDGVINCLRGPDSGRNGEPFHRAKSRKSRSRKMEKLRVDWIGWIRRGSSYGFLVPPRFGGEPVATRRQQWRHWWRLDTCQLSRNGEPSSA